MTVVTGPRGWHGTAAAASALPRLQIPVRPAQFETAPWYLRRLCLANGVDPVWIGGLVRTRRQVADDPSEAGRAIAEMGGPGPEHWEASHARASVGLKGVRVVGDAYSRHRRTRLACLSCTEGEAIATYDHVRFGFCTKHGRWAGPGTGETTQRVRQMDSEQHHAERAARRLVTRGLVDVDLYETAWEVTRDWAYMSGHWPDRLRRAADQELFTREVDDRIALYPETVRLLRVIASSPFQVLMDLDFEGATYRRGFLHRALDWLPGDRWIVAEGIEEWVVDRQDRLATHFPVDRRLATVGGQSYIGGSRTSVRDTRSTP